MLNVVSHSRVRVLLTLLAVCLLCASAFAARPGTIIVVENANDSGPGSLRQAILDGNADGASHVRIQFASAFTINVTSALPLTTRTLSIEGNDAVTVQGPGSGTGFMLSAGSQISGLTVQGFGSAVHMEGSNCMATHCTLRDNTGSGLQIEGSYAQVSDCVISANGVGITMVNASNNNVYNCKIGTNAAGDAVDENMVGIEVFGGHDNTIGVPTQPNIISGNRVGGVYVSASANFSLLGNWIGTNAAGNAPLLNPYNDEAPGIPDPDVNVFGFKAVNCTHLRTGIGLGSGFCNLITGFQKDIHLEGVDDACISSDLLGLNATGTAALPTPNGSDALDAHGIQMANGGNLYMKGCSNVQVGTGFATSPIPGYPGQYYTDQQNAFANTSGYAIEMDGCTNCSLSGNLIGLTLDGLSLADGRGPAMLYLHGGSGNRIGGGINASTFADMNVQNYPNRICASGAATAMLAVSNESNLAMVDPLGLAASGLPMGHAHVFLNVGGSSTTGNQSLGIHLAQDTLTGVDRPICVSDLAEPQGLADSHNPFGSYDPTWSNERISWPALDSATSAGITGHYLLPAGRAVTFHFYTSSTPGNFVRIGSYSLSGAANSGSGSFTAPIPISVGQTVYATTVDEFGSSSEFSDAITGTAANHAPSASAGSDQNGTVPHDGNPGTNTASVTLDASGSNDPDAGQSLTYQWKDETNAVVGSSAQVNLALASGTHTFTVTVTDPFGAQSWATTHVTVNPEANSAPSVDGGLDATVASGNAFVRTATFADPENDAVQVAWYEGATLLSSTASLNAVLGTGSHTLTVTATDSYGAMSTDTVVVNVTVNYGWHGFDQPINNDNSSIFKQGSTIPVKFSLTNGTPVAHLYLAKITNSVIGTELEATSTSAADSGNTFRLTSTGYVFNLSTKGLTVGTWQLRVDLGDGDTSHWVLISIK